MNNYSLIATGTLYIYFEIKETLMTELFWLCRRESADYYFSECHHHESFAEGFRVIFRKIVEYRLEHFRKFVFLEQCYHSPFINEKARKESLKALDPIFRLLEKGKDKRNIYEMYQICIDGIAAR